MTINGRRNNYLETKKKEMQKELEKKQKKALIEMRIAILRKARKIEELPAYEKKKINNDLKNLFKEYARKEFANV